MRNQGSKIGLTTVAALWVVSFSICLYSQNHERSRMPSKTLSSLQVEGVTVIDALLRLGQEQRVALGVEYVDRAAVSKPITLKVGPTTVADALDAILASVHGYQWGFRDGVVHITHTGRPGSRNLLDFVLPRFDITQSSPQEVSHQLQMALEWALHPGVKGILGDYSPGSTRNVIGPWRLRNVTVRQVLDRMVSEKGDAAWVVQVAPGRLDQLPSGGLWTLVEYDDATVMGHVGDLLRHTIFGWEPVPSAEKRD